MRYLITASLISLAFFAPAHADDNESPSKQPPWSQADKYFDKADMAKARAAVLKRNGGMAHSFFMADRLELQAGDEGEALVWDGMAWHGTDENKLWVKTEGEYSFEGSEFEEAEIQALWSKPVSTYFDVQAGLRQDLHTGGDTYAVAGVQGLAPYWFEIDAATFLSTKGNFTARFEAEYELLFTQKLVLQPRAEFELSAQDIPSQGLGAGVTSVEAGLRLRYEIKPEFAPYIGVEWGGALGETRGIVRAGGGEPSHVAVLLGLRIWQ